MLLQLTPEPAVPVHDLPDGLRAFQNLRSPRHCTGWFRGTPKKWEGSDGEAVVQALLEAKKHPIPRAVSLVKLPRRLRWFMQALVACLVLMSPISAQESDLLSAPAKSTEQANLDLPGDLRRTLEAAAFSFVESKSTNVAEFGANFASWQTQAAIPPKSLRRSLPTSLLPSVAGQALKGPHQRDAVLSARSVIAAAVSEHGPLGRKQFGRRQLVSPEFSKRLFQMMEAASAKTAQPEP